MNKEEEMLMKKSASTMAVSLGIIFFIATVHSVAHAAEISKKPVTPATATVVAPPIKNTFPGKTCADPAVSLVLTKTLTAGTAQISMQATVCNKGSEDYVGQSPLDASFYVITWHPPKTAAQEHDWKSISHLPISAKLAKGECKTLTQHYTIPGVTMWGHTTASAAVRQAVKELGVRIEKQYPVQPGFGLSVKENCSIANDTAYETLLYMEKI
jgi:hypothetical protein